MDQEVPNEQIQKIFEEVKALEKEEDLEYIMEDVDSLLAESLDGTERVKRIVLGLKSFARLDDEGVKESDINAGIESTLKVLWNEIKYKCTLTKNLGELPLVKCDLGKINRVFMNLVVNADQAIPERGEINIETEATDSDVLIRISDTGEGIPKEALQKIFDPFYTWRPSPLSTES
jgi:signal transduction histidine kinase